MKKIGIHLMLLILILNWLLIPALATDNVTQETQIPNAETQPQRVEDIVGIDAPGAILGTGKLVSNVRSAAVYESNSGTMMYAYNADTQMYPASLVKIMTALIAIEKGVLTDEVIVSDTAISSIPYDAVSMKLSSGEVITLENLLS